MYFVAFFGVAGVVAMLRFGPRSPMPEDEDHEDVPERKAVEPAVVEGESSPNVWVWGGLKRGERSTIDMTRISSSLYAKLCF